MSQQAITEVVEDYVSDEELDAGYIEPEEGEEETHDEELLDSLAAQAYLKEENYVDDESLVESGEE